MANPERGEVGVTIGEKVYNLRPTFDALCELEALVDKPLHEVMRGVEQGRVSGLRSVIWCLLQDEHSAEIKTLKDASVWIEAVGGADAALVLVMRAMGLNSDPEAEQTANPPDAQSDGIGDVSSKTPVASV